MAAKGQAKLHLELMGAKQPVLHHIQKINTADGMCHLPQGRYTWIQ